MNITEAIILGTIQGITEWLPISSSGHLAITHKILNIKSSPAFDVALHLGTLLAITAIYWRDLIEMIKATLRLDTKSPAGKTTIHLVVATIPAAVIGYLFNDYFETLFENIPLIGAALIATGILLLLASKTRGRNEIGLKEAVVIGLAQAASIIPGISRSGSTISAGMLSGVEKNKALQFSFLMSLPITLGASIFELKDAGLLEINPTNTVIGITTAFIAGYLSIKLLINMIKESKLQYFAYYCLTAGIITILFLSS